MGVALPMWFYYEAVAKGSRLDVSSKRQVVVRIQFHREDRPLYSVAILTVDKVGRPAPLGLHASSNEVGFCHAIAFDEAEGRVSGLCVESVDADDRARLTMVSPDIFPNRVLYRGIGAVREADICVGRQTC